METFKHGFVRSSGEIPGLTRQEKVWNVGNSEESFPHSTPQTITTRIISLVKNLTSLS